MKRCLFLLLLMGIGMQGQIINFPDPNFKAILLLADVGNYIARDAGGNQMKVDANTDGEIQLSEALAVARLQLYHYPVEPALAISSLEGIQNFTNLKRLECFSNNLSSLPVMDDLVNLEYFDCSSNQLTNVHEIENLTSLKSLVVSWNPITAVDFSNLNNLEYVHCRNTLLSCIDVSATNVYGLWCGENPNLRYINVQNGRITVYPRLAPGIPPPLPHLNFELNPNLQQVCYDEGEYPSVEMAFTFFGGSVGSTSLTTSCVGFDCTALGITDVLTSQFMVFPNPTSGMVTIMNPEELTINKISVSTILGQHIMSLQNTTEIDISPLAKGTYFLTIETGSGKVVKKLIKQ